MSRHATSEAFPHPGSLPGSTVGLATDQDATSELTNKAERKRVLNVLAQRRYRQRQKHKLQQYRTMNNVAQESLQVNVIPDFASASASFVPEESCAQADNGLLGRIHEGGVGSGNLFETFLNPGTSNCKDNEGTSLQPLFQHGVEPGVLGNTTAEPMWHPLSGSSSLPGDTSQGFLDPALLSSWLQIDEIASTTFADDCTFEVPMLNLLNAAQILAGHIHSLDRLFDMSATSIFNTTTRSDTSWVLALPENLQPTPAQFSVPHHPLLDLLPWPPVRTKLICMFSMPVAASLRDPKGGFALDFLRFVHDVDDGGLLVSGEEPANIESWEIGSEEFLRRWWWVFDSEILSQTNIKRRKRGLLALKFRS